jgi:endonuclease/exonuclease/phosphatase family metal-dependent hydrolase
MTHLTIATLNLRNRSDRWLERRDLVVAELLALQPDLVGLQEIYMPIRQGYWLRNQLNARLAHQPPYRLLQARKRHPIKGYFEGIGILTRLPILSSDIMNLGYDGRVALRAGIELPSHTPLDFVVTHLHHVARDRQARLEQVMSLMGWLQHRGPVSHQIVVGDFNETPDGPAILQMKAAYDSAFERAVGYEPLATYPTGLVGGDWAGCLDYIFVSKSVDKVRRARLFCTRPAPQDENLFPSDHVGLLVDVHIP